MDKKILNQLAKGTAVLVLTASLFGCEEGRRPRDGVKSVPLSSEQAACMARTGAKLEKVAADVNTLHLDALKNNRPFIQWTLQARRAREEICLEQANCFGLGEPVLSVMFDSCLEAAERQEKSN